MIVYLAGRISGDKNYKRKFETGHVPGYPPDIPQPLPPASA